MDLFFAGAITIEQVGSYAGFASVLGLAVLSALYFSQARDVKRLRDWAGRAPERDAEARSRVAAATSAGQAQQQQQRPVTPSTPATAQPAATTNAGNSDQAAVTASKAPAVAAGAGAGIGTGARPGGTPGARALGARPSAPTSVLAGQGKDPLGREPWYRRIAPRYIALIVAGVLVVGGGIAVGAVTLLSGSDSGGAGSEQAEPKADTSGESSRPVRAADVSLAVLNGTGIPGLADQFADKAEAQGFKRDNVGNAPGGQRAESVILYAPGKEREARLVRREFDISAIEPVDTDSQGIAPDADVFLVVGSDNTQ